MHVLILTKDELNAIIEWADLAETSVELTDAEKKLRNLVRTSQQRPQYLQ